MKARSELLNEFALRLRAIADDIHGSGRMLLDDLHNDVVLQVRDCEVWELGAQVQKKPPVVKKVDLRKKLNPGSKPSGRWRR